MATAAPSSTPQSSSTASSAKSSSSSIIDSDKMSATDNPTTSALGAVSNGIEEIKEFVRVGRTGRRNAIADMNLDPSICMSPASLSELMKKIDFNDKPESEAND